jgi:hypothetical protein
MFYIHQHGKIPATIAKSKLAKAFGYQSDGHFYEDWNYLVRSGLVSQDNTWVRITRKGRREFLPIAILWLGGVLSFFYGVLFLEQYWLSLRGFEFAVPPVLASVLFLFTMGGSYIYVYYLFRPKIPREAKDLL